MDIPAIRFTRLEDQPRSALDLTIRFTCLEDQPRSALDLTIRFTCLEDQPRSALSSRAGNDDVNGHRSPLPTEGGDLGEGVRTLNSLDYRR